MSRIEAYTPEFQAWFAKSRVTDAAGTPVVVYHGTPTCGAESNNRYVRAEQADVEFREFTVFDTGLDGVTDSGWLGRGSYFTPDPDFAFEFGNFIMPVYLSLQNPFVVHDDSSTSRSNIFRFLMSLQALDGLPEEFRLDLSMPADEERENHAYGKYQVLYDLHESTWDGESWWMLVGGEKRGTGCVESKGKTREEAIFNFRYKDQFHGFLLHIIQQIGNAAFSDLLQRNDHDGVISMRDPYTHRGETLPQISEAVAFHPGQIKSAIGNSGRFDPADPDITDGAARLEARLERKGFRP